MFLLYLRKLFWMVIGFLGIGVVYFLCYPLLATFSGLFENPVLKYGILMGIPTAIVMGMVYNSRTRNYTLRKEYLDSVRDCEYSDRKTKIKKEVLYFLHFPAFWAEVLAFSTPVLPFVTAIGITTENDAPLYAKCLAGIIVVLEFVGVYTILDVALWLGVHGKWKKNDRLKKDMAGDNL